MCVERALRLIGGGFVMASVLAGMYVSPHFLWFTLFVGANLFQSGFTNSCPMMAILRRAGVPDTRCETHRIARQPRYPNRDDSHCRLDSHTSRNTQG